MAAQQASAAEWIGTWASVPVDHDPRNSFQQQTLRRIVHTSIGGTRARIQVSNLFGTQPLKIEDAHIALRSSGVCIIAATDRQLRFGGRDSIGVPPGASARSDAVAFPVLPAIGRSGLLTRKIHLNAA